MWNIIKTKSVETHCPSGFSEECPAGSSCYGGLGCNVQDIIAIEDEASSGEDGTTIDDDEPVRLPKTDARRKNFCGKSWGDASATCSDW